MPVNVTPGINWGMKEVKELANVIRTAILPAMQNAIGQEVILVNSRLNETNVAYPSPVWAAWVGSPKLKYVGGYGDEPPDGLIGSTHLSPIYTKCLTWPQRDFVHELNYSDVRVRAAEKTQGAFQHDVNLGLNYRRYVCIVVDGRRIGTLTVGFKNAPGDDDKVKNELRSWAKANPQLIDFLRSSFNLSGPQI